MQAAALVFAGVLQNQEYQQCAVAVALLCAHTVVLCGCLSASAALVISQQHTAQQCACCGSTCCESDTACNGRVVSHFTRGLVVGRRWGGGRSPELVGDSHSVPLEGFMVSGVEAYGLQTRHTSWVGLLQQQHSWSRLQW